jgi:hypothetical protein
MSPSSSAALSPASPGQTRYALFQANRDLLSTPDQLQYCCCTTCTQKPTKDSTPEWKTPTTPNPGVTIHQKGGGASIAGPKCHTLSIFSEGPWWRREYTVLHRTMPFICSCLRQLTTKLGLRKRSHSPFFFTDKSHVALALGPGI